MIELIAGALVAAAALAYVLQPLARGRAPARMAPSEATAASYREAEALAEHFRARLRTACSRCQCPAEPGAIFCLNCGAVLIGRRRPVGAAGC